jgi:hypothetical protein
MNLPRLLSLEMTAAITGSNPSFLMNRVYPAGRLLQARAARSNVMAFYQRQVCIVLARSASIGIADARTGPVG